MYAYSLGALIHDCHEIKKKKDQNTRFKTRINQRNFLEKKVRFNEIVE